MFCVSQNVLRELEQKKPQLDELVHTAENLKADSNRQQLHGKGRLHLQNTLLCIFVVTVTLELFSDFLASSHRPYGAMTLFSSLGM